MRWSRILKEVNGEQSKKLQRNGRRSFSKLVYERSCCYSLMWILNLLREVFNKKKELPKCKKTTNSSRDKYVSISIWPSTTKRNLAQ